MTVNGKLVYFPVKQKVSVKAITWNLKGRSEVPAG